MEEVTEVKQEMEEPETGERANIQTPMAPIDLEKELSEIRKELRQTLVKIRTLTMLTHYYGQARGRI